MQVELPLEGALHLLLLLVGILDLMRDPSQELLEVGQEVRLVPPQLRPEAAHLSGAEERTRELDSVDAVVTLLVAVVVVAVVVVVVVATLTPQTHYSLPGSPAACKSVSPPRPPWPTAWPPTGSGTGPPSCRGPGCGRPPWRSSVHAGTDLGGGGAT